MKVRPAIVAAIVVAVCVDGSIPVRAPDGAHFCPTGFQVPCPVYSSGAARFGRAEAAVIDATARTGYPNRSTIASHRWRRPFVFRNRGTLAHADHYARVTSIQQRPRSS